MSRIGKLPIKIPRGVNVTIMENIVNVKGTKGELSFKVPDVSKIKLVQDDNTIRVEKLEGSNEADAYQGLVQRSITNMILGVTKGFSRELEIIGVGYRAQMEGSTLVLFLGYSHPIKYPPPKGITIQSPKPTSIVVSGIDKQQVGQVAAEIRGFRSPEPYKGKGVRYAGEFVKRKAGKTGVK